MEKSRDKAYGFLIQVSQLMVDRNVDFAWFLPWLRRGLNKKKRAFMKLKHPVWITN